MALPTFRVVVLSGGLSHRFQGDKLRAPLAGRPVLARTVEALRPLASEVVLATSSSRRGAAQARLLDGRVRVLADRTGRWGAGPGAALASALDQVRGRPLLVVPGDMPWTPTRVWATFAARANAVAADVVVPYWHGGVTEHLVQWHPHRRVLRRLSWARPEAAGGRRASDVLRAAPRTGFVPIARLTDRAEEFAHVTRRSDLSAPAPRGTLGPRGPTRVIAGGPKGWYQRAVRARGRGSLAVAGDAFYREARGYHRRGWPLLAAHAIEDAQECTPEADPVRALRAILRSRAATARRRS